MNLSSLHKKQSPDDLSRRLVVIKEMPDSRGSSLSLFITFASPEAATNLIANYLLANTFSASDGIRKR